MALQEIRLYRLRVPLKAVYNTALGYISELDAIVAEIRDRDGRVGLGEATVVPGYTHETPDGAWDLCRAWAGQLAGGGIAAAKRALDPFRGSDPHAVSVLQMALEMIERNPALRMPDHEVAVPILGAINDKDPARIPDEIEERLAAGFRTLKVKVGWDVDSDLARLSLIQKRNNGRASLRVDANQGYSREDGCRFAAALDPQSLQLFEQPCAAADWEANAAVAAVSRVPVMMDESIYGFDDIERAATMKGCGFVKLKIGKMTGCDLLRDGLARVAELGLGPIMGNGAATDIGCFVEAGVARTSTPFAGEMNGFLKNKIQLLDPPLSFRDGAIVLEPGFEPRLNARALASLGAVSERFVPSVAAVPAPA